MKTALLELHYLPCLAYFTALRSCGEILVEKHDPYQKQTYRNRCYIKGPHQVETLIIPVIRAGGKTRICDVRIDYSQKWLNNHWRTIKTAYGNAPFFEHYSPDLYKTFFLKPPFLYDLNLALMTLCLQWLKIQPVLKETDHYHGEVESGVLDLRDVINPKKEDGCNRFYKSIEYQQVFGSKFVPNLSLIDLIFNQGPGARDILNASANDEQ